MTDEEINKYKEVLLTLLPQTGAAIGNMRAYQLLQVQVKEQFGETITKDDYWTIRNASWDDGTVGIGRGKGGSIFLLNTQKPTPPPGTPYNNENDLYDPILQTLKDSWVKNFRIEDFVTEKTARQGSRDTGGKWTRPDLVLVTVRIYPYIPGKSIELISFEVKYLNAYGVEGVFETASHSAFAHRSYLMIYVPPGFNDAKVLDRLDSESARFGIGFYTFEDPQDWESYDLRIDAQAKNPDPFILSEFIRQQLSDHSKRQIEKWTK
jgi:hypothetical protein